ncbi:MAG TPA: MFS transporter [Mucilaginibacter sp.]|nr:MFS transporter [Mucilaginibacter sp.]
MNDLKRAKNATKIIFLVCGLAISSWAPMIPFVKDKLRLNDGSLGLLILFLGTGAIITMPLTGWLIHKVGTRMVITVASVVIALSFPIVLWLNNWFEIAGMLFIFGSGIGSIDVAMNTHGVHVQNMAGKPIMSSLHGLFSVGGLCGPIVVGILIKAGLEPSITAEVISISLLAITLTQFGSLLEKNTEHEISAKFTNLTEGDGNKKFSLLNGAVLFLGVMCFVAFLSEGAVLDWSAVFLRDNKGVDKAMAGVGYACFSIAMAIMRLFGDRIVSKTEDKNVVIYGSIIAFAGFMLVVFAPWLFVVLIGFVLIGVGAANIVPVFFTAAGRIKNVASSKAVSAIGTMGYAGQLVGPAILGFIAHHFSLPAALFVTGLLLLSIGLAYQVKSIRNVQ